jgi:hypothetical protein
MQFSHDSIKTSPNESNLKLDVMSPCRGGYHILAGSRMQPLAAAKSWLVLGCSRQPATEQVTIGVAAISVTVIN